MKKLYLLIGVVSAAACRPGVRFSDRAVLWKDPDDKPIPMPAPRDPPYHWVAIRDAAFNPLDRALAIDYARESVNVNALDETPDSSWWSDRRRTSTDPRPRGLSEEEVGRGAFGERPRPVLPLTVTKGKEKGGNLGFIVKDALGRQFAIKIDPPGYVALETSTEVVVSRLAWAAGWNVPAESIVDLQLGDLVLSPKATTTNVAGDKIPLDPEHFRQVLARAPMSTAGTVRALASMWIDGTPVGPYTYFGRRRDDPNDRVPHEDRRDLRGYGIFCAWVNNIDTTEANTFDSYIGDKGKGHLVHWQQDVGGSFGSRAGGAMDYWMGADTYFSPGRMVESLFSFGIVNRAWEGEGIRARRARALALYPEVGWFDSDGFDPRKWQPIFDNPAFVRATSRDAYWGAKRIVQMGEGELRAAIAEGHYRAAAADRLFQILWKRREAIARAYFSTQTPLDYFRVENGQLCWDDLWIAAQLDGERSADYEANGRPIPRDQARCTAVGRGYQVVSLTVRRNGQRHFSAPVNVHLSDRKIVGVER
ncbi:MAG: hypothetical protein JWN44_6597 [Myxococcales bacterium]|nr:hypothetical protein [Myxococcales bacterium]